MTVLLNSIPKKNKECVGMSNSPLLQLQTNLERESREEKKVMHNKDLAEVLVKLGMILSVAGYRFSKRMQAEDKAKLLRELRAPSLGNFKNLFDSFAGKADGFWREPAQFLKDNKFSDTIKEVSDLRNHLAHGHIPKDKEAVELNQSFQKVILPLLEWDIFRELKFQVEKSTNEALERVILDYRGNTLEASPFIYKHENAFYFYNGYERDFTAYFIYYKEESGVVRGNGWKEEVEDMLTLKAYSLDLSTKFQTLLPGIELGHTERSKELKEVVEFLDNPNSKGCIAIEGNWGMGKTTFLSRIILYLQKRNRESKKIKYQIVEYFKTVEGITNTPEFFEEYFLARAKDYVNFEEEGDFERVYEDVLQKMKEKSSVSGNPVFFIDNVDKLNPEIFKYIQKALYSGFRMVYTTRHDYLDINTNLTSLKDLTTKKIVLQPLTDSMIKTFWNDKESKKYKEKTIFQIATEKTNRNPLFFRLWAQSIRTGRRDIGILAGDLKIAFENQIAAIKKERNNSNDFFPLLDLLCYTKTPLSMEEISELLKISTEKTLSILDGAKDFLKYEEGRWSIDTSGFVEYYKELYLVPVNLVRSNYIIPCIERGVPLPKNMGISEMFVKSYLDVLQKGEVSIASRKEKNKIRARFGV